MKECNFRRHFEENLEMQQQQQQQQQQLCLENISLEVERGELIGVIGHMGSGKSTLIEAIAGYY